MSTLGVANVGEPITTPGTPHPARWRLTRAFQTWLDRPSSFDGIFTARQRRLGIAWVALTLPFLALYGLLADTPDAYVFVFVFFGSGTYTLPALPLTWLAARRAPAGDPVGVWFWFAGLVLIFSTGVGMLVGLVTGWRFGNRLALPVIVLITVLLMIAVVKLVRTRSGRRALSVDLVEAAMSLAVVLAPAILIWGDRVVAARAPWFAVPAAVATVGMVFACYWAVVLYVRRGAQAGPLEVCGIVLALAGAVNAGVQAAQGVTGFTLSAPPLIALHALCMSMLLLVPLHLPRSAGPGLDRLPPHAQVRGGWLAGVLTLAGLPVLLAATVVAGGWLSWAAPFSLGVMTLLLVLAAVRHLVAVRETRRLYADLELASEERRRLLARVMARADEDRHRVAAQLHEQAVSAYASFVSFIQAAGSPSGESSASLAGASTMVRDDLARHADSLRHLMLAIQPLRSEPGPSQTLAAPIHAYVDSLYGDGQAPRLRVDVADDLVLDWITETIVLRIVQEALRNVWGHSGARAVVVTVGTGEAGHVEVRVADDGVGFDPATTMFESGISAMRSFAGVVHGRVALDSARASGTTVVATLGDVASDPKPSPEPAPRLRLVRGGAD